MLNIVFDNIQTVPCQRHSATSRAAAEGIAPRAGTKRAKQITAEQAAEFMAYDPETGALSWKKKPNRNVRLSDPVGSMMPRGYIQVSLLGTKYLAHRIAWLLYYGEWPENLIDHINGDRADNRIANIRDVTQDVNMQNLRGPTALNKVGLLGVRKKRKKFQAQIRLHGATTHIGTFATPEEAHQAYIAVKRKAHKGCTL